MKREVWRRLLLAVSVVASATVGLQSPASGAHGDGYDAGDYHIVFSRCNLDLAVNHWVVHHLNNDVDDLPEGPAQTDVDTEKPVQCITDDVRIQDGNYGDTGWDGHWDCTDWHDADSCNHGEVRINFFDPNIPENDGATLGIVCHEIGHSVGLGHSTEAATLHG